MSSLLLWGNDLYICISSEEFTKAGRVKNVEKYLLNICLRIHKLTLVFLLDDG